MFLLIIRILETSQRLLHLIAQLWNLSQTFLMHTATWHIAFRFIAYSFFVKYLYVQYLLIVCSL